MKRFSLQWRITIMTALLTCAACVLTNCLVGYTGMRYMDAIGSDISALNATGEDSAVGWGKRPPMTRSRSS